MSIGITIADTGLSSVSGQGGQLIYTGIPTPGSFALIPFIGAQGAFRLQITGTFSATLQFLGSIDGGITYTPVNAVIQGVGTVLQSVTSQCVVNINNAALTNVLVRCSAYTSGSAIINSASANAEDFQNLSLDASSIVIGDVTVTNFPTTVDTNSGAATASTLRTIAAPPVVTRQKGQVVIATTGTAVRLTATSYILQNGVIITSGSNNSATGGTVGDSSVTNTVNGTGNGALIYAGGSTSEGAGVNINSIYVNGTLGDVFSWLGS